MSQGWWRRNRVALPAMVVTLAALAWPMSEPARELWWPSQPRVAHQAGGEGWAAIGEVRVRLAGFGQAEIAADELPPGLTVWRAEIEAEGAAESMPCDALLADSNGRTYPPGSRHLPSFDDQSFGLECGAGDDSGGVVYFLVPDEVRPAYVRVIARDLLPDYWELPHTLSLP